ncbi:hypothetical protein QYM36_007433 [Artemia franciscana]|uniref:Calponin-homology (CH) domain-containing protein n=1 Tax=Artemia franciscana TaxID=6661 RepID=A0AA88LH05_ARTSF|nr:hypothetical protein QYM36_007433 [Artemia franciscana]
MDTNSPGMGDKSPIIKDIVRVASLSKKTQPKDSVDFYEVESKGISENPSMKCTAETDNDADIEEDTLKSAKDKRSEVSRVIIPGPGLQRIPVRKSGEENLSPSEKMNISIEPWPKRIRDSSSESTNCARLKDLGARIASSTSSQIAINQPDFALHKYHSFRSHDYTSESSDDSSNSTPWRKSGNRHEDNVVPWRVRRSIEIGSSNHPDTSITRSQTSVESNMSIPSSVESIILSPTPNSSSSSSVSSYRSFDYGRIPSSGDNQSPFSAQITPIKRKVLSNIVPPSPEKLAGIMRQSDNTWPSSGISSGRRHSSNDSWYAEFRFATLAPSHRTLAVKNEGQYDSHITSIKDEQERVQKKTFVNWINSYLSKRVPPARIDDLIEDLKDGTKLIALLEVLSAEKLPVEKGRNLRRPHFLSNANTALKFLQGKRIKLVNINASDVVDGRPAVVLGLIWTIILYFQVLFLNFKNMN